MTVLRHLGFLKVRNFNCWSGSEVQYASSCQILCQSVKPLPKYRNFYFFRISAAAILDFLNFKCARDQRVMRAEVRHPAKFRLNLWNCGRDVAIFRFFKMAAAAMLDFWHHKFLTVGRIISVELHHHAKRRGDRSNRCWDISILDLIRWRQPPSWIFKIFKFLTIGTVKKDKLCHCAKFCRNRSKNDEDMSVVRFFSRWSPLPSLIFKFLHFKRSERSRGSNCISMPNFVKSVKPRPRYGNIAIFRFFKVAAAALLDFWNFKF